MRALVTGATGFIGGRLAQRLAQEEGAVVTGSGRSLDKVPFLRQAGVNLQKADLLDTARMRQLVSNQAIVFDVAAWVGQRHGNSDKATALNVTATENLVRVAAESGVSRVVHVSSIAAYGTAESDVIDESHPLDTEQSDDYGRTKAMGEQRALQLGAELGLEVTVVRPAMVYGPRSQGWTVSMLKLVKSGTPVIIGDGLGHAYPVYIDNLIDGMLLTAVHPRAAGQAFNFCDRPLDWRTFFGYYGDMCGRQPRSIPLWLAKMVAAINDALGLRLPLTRRRIKFYTRQSRYPTTRAENLLGYQARVTIDEGMRRAEAWLRQEGYLNGE
jgi:nucleoside-diphosphate-sugar epimerase